MKRYLFILITLISLCAGAQPVFINGARIDTLMISGYESAYLWLDKGHGSYARGDNMIIVYDSSISAYVFSEFTTKESYNTPKESKDKSKAYDSIVSIKIESSALDSLLQALQERAVKPDAEQMGITATVMTDYLTEECIRKELKEHLWPEYWKHHKRELTLADSPALFASILSLDTFRNYVTTFAIDTNPNQGESDDYDISIHIHLAAGGKHYHYLSRGYDSFMQPWLQDPMDEMIKVGNYYAFVPWKATFNFSVNKYLLAILPKGFIVPRAMRKEDYMRRYLTWFVKHQSICTIQK